VGTPISSHLFPLLSPPFHPTALLPPSAHQSATRPRQQLLNRHSIFSPPFFLHSEIPLSLVSDPSAKFACNYFFITHQSNTLSLSLPLYLSISISLTPVSFLCSKTEHHFPSQQCSLVPPISVSDHPSQSILMALAKRPFSAPASGTTFNKPCPPTWLTSRWQTRLDSWRSE